MDAQVDIWTIALDEFRVNVLAGDEAVRAARFHFERDRVRWTAARSALRLVLAKYVAGEMEFVKGPHGKPSLRGGGVEFNLSHAHGWAMIAVARSVAVGVDIECIREGVDMAKLLGRLGEADLPEGRTALFQRWSAREARTKATGSPLMERPSPEVRAVALTAPAGFVAAVAMAGIVPEPVYRGSL